MSLARALILSLGVLSISACRTDLVRVQPVATSVQAPGQVAVYVAVADGDKPITDLGTDDFTVYEDGEKLDSTQVKLTKLDADPYVENQTLLLVDTSGSDDAVLAPAVAAFVRKARDGQAVSVYAFDGSDGIRKVADFQREVASKEPQKIDLGKGGDASRNLNGAVLKALDALDESLAKAPKPVHVGTLVVVTRGGDLAGRATEEQLRARLEQSSRTSIYAVSIGEEVRLDQIGRTGTAHAASTASAQSTLEEVAATTNALQHSHYLLAYCSPARAGLRVLRVEVTRKEDDKRSRTGGAELRFDASGFDAQCDPKQPPRFVVSLLYDDEGPIAAAAPQRAELEEESDEQGKKEGTTRARAASRPATAAGAPRPAAGATPPPGPKPAPAEKPAEKPSDGFEP